MTIFGAAKHAGASLFGPDLSKWPAHAVDAQVALEIERILEHNARLEADSSD